MGSLTLRLRSKREQYSSAKSTKTRPDTMAKLITIIRVAPIITLDELFIFLGVSPVCVMTVEESEEDF